MTTNKDALKLLWELHGALREAYKAANTLEHKDRIFAVMEVVSDEINALVSMSLQQKNKEYTAVTAQMKEVSGKLQKLKEDIDDMIKYIGVATNVINGIGRILPLLLV